MATALTWVPPVRNSTFPSGHWHRSSSKASARRQ